MIKGTNQPNHLIHETSPYLLSHAYNPVQWYPWAAEALGLAKRLQKPIFLSIGYSACHWCHVMERESFEDVETAKIMNECFVSIKVDREERPDLDHIYMSAVQVMTQHGGWPMSVFLTPDLEPFYGGTYFPPDDRMGMPSFKKVLQGVANAWKNRREEVLKSASDMKQALLQMARSVSVPDGTELSPALLKEAVRSFVENFDEQYGGLGQAPKFFHTLELRLCLRAAYRNKDQKALEVVSRTLTQMARGGIYDQIGGGFHRYSTDAQWLVPHFEKMLYDNALLALTYLEAYQATSDSFFATVARDVLDYVEREMTSDEGGFYSSQDADSEDEEGKFFVWKKEELKKGVGAEQFEIFCKAFDVTDAGNWEGSTILHVKDAKAFEQLKFEKLRAKLRDIRSKRPAPFRDEKILVSWNGLMIEAFAKAYAVLGEGRYLDIAKKGADFLLNHLVSSTDSKAQSMKLFHGFKNGISRLNAYLDDYACFANGLAALYEASFESRWLVAAKALATTMLKDFWDKESGGFFYTANDHEKLLTRPKEHYDGAVPSSTGVAISVLLRLGKALGDADWIRKAEKILQSFQPQMQKVPGGSGQFLLALDMLLNESFELVLVPGKARKEYEACLSELRKVFLPGSVLIGEGQNLSKGKSAVSDQVSLYVCEKFTCRSPLVGKKQIREFLLRHKGNG